MTDEHQIMKRIPATTCHHFAPLWLDDHLSSLRLCCSLPSSVGEVSAAAPTLVAITGDSSAALSASG